MNTPHENRPREVCRLARGWAALRGLDSPPATGHLAHCAECRRYFAVSHTLEKTLTRDARRGEPQIPEGLDRRISLAVARSHRSKAAAPRRPRGTLFAATSICAAAALVVAGLVVNRRLKSSQETQAPLSAAEQAQLAAAVVNLPGSLWESVKPSATAVWQAEPLQREATDLESDARSAIGFLKANFLPSDGPAPRPKASPST